MSTARLDTALMITVAQILDGEATCEHCDAKATATLATGADPESWPTCWDCGGKMVSRALYNARNLVSPSRLTKAAK